ncbi:beta-lactamase/transpeptidase-like protein [Hyaloraphidium curvatum]|nr:beta-lactamase/transpeptidase-like protein [Hyaloraphidium curvatum]
MAAPPARLSFLDIGMFQGVPQHDNFARFKELFANKAMPPSASPRPFPEGKPAVLPETFEFDGKTLAVEDSLKATDTAALLVLRDGKVVHERYFLSGGRDVVWPSMSVAKSFTSALVGIAVAEGLIGSIEEPISKYISAEPGSAYDGVCIKDVLQMSSGARWVEDYSDPESDIMKFGACFTGGNTLDNFVAKMAKEVPPGTLCRYNSGDTQALGNLLVRATGKGIAEYMSEKLVGPLGFEDTGYWLIDTEGREMAFGGLLLTARDFAKIGELYRNGGKWDGKQVVPADWVAASTKADADHLMPGQTEIAGHKLPVGYGYQWWLWPGGPHYSAEGVYNQNVYVAPQEGVVVVKLSANRLYGTTMGEESNKDGENGALIVAIAKAVAKQA